MIILIAGALIAPLALFLLSASLPDQAQVLAMIGGERALVLRAGAEAGELAQPDSVVKTQDFSATIDELDRARQSLNAKLLQGSPRLRDMFFGTSSSLDVSLAEFIAAGQSLAIAGGGADLARNVQQASDGPLQAGLADAALVEEDQLHAAVSRLRWAGPLITLIPLMLGFAILARAAMPALARIRRLIGALERLAGRDPLTGLLNRNSFMVSLRRLVRPEAPAKTGLIRLDIDLFRAFNLAYGDAAGDMALRKLGTRMRNGLGENALVTRFGADEFAVALPKLKDRDQLEQMAARLLQLISEPLNIGDRVVQLHATGGAAMAPDDAVERGELLMLAEDALREAKREARGAVRMHLASADAATLRRARMFRALQDEDFRGLTVHLQPQFGGRHLALRGFEALARWHHPELGTISPADFIPAARASRHMARMFAELLAASFAATNALRGAGVPVARIGLNISSAELSEPDVLALLPQALEKAGLSPSDIEIQTTEALLTDSADEASRQLLSDLRAKGAWLVLDDFGTGFASLPLLQRFAVDAVMIDGTFVRGIGEQGDRAEEMIRAMVGLARGLGIAAVAENVETQQQLSFLRGLGCDAMQGFLFAPAMPVAAIPEWWRAYAIEHPQMA